MPALSTTNSCSFRDCNDLIRVSRRKYAKCEHTETLGGVAAIVKPDPHYARRQRHS